MDYLIDNPYHIRKLKGIFVVRFWHGNRCHHPNPPCSGAHLQMRFLRMRDMEQSLLCVQVLNVIQASRANKSQSLFRDSNQRC